MGHDYATFKQQLFDIPKAPAEAEAESHDVANDLNGKAVILYMLGK